MAGHPTRGSSVQRAVSPSSRAVHRLGRHARRSGLRAARPALAAFLAVALGFAGLSPRAADAAPPLGPTEVTVPLLSDAERLARAADFERANPGFTVPNHGEPGVNALDGAVRVARRTPLPARAAKVGAAEAEAKAKAFVRRNAAALGVTAAELPRLKVKTSAPPMKPHRDWPAAWSVAFDADFTPRAHAAFHELRRAAHLVVTVFDDGDVGLVLGSNEGVRSDALRVEPGLRADDPRVLAEVIGRPLRRFEPVGALENTYVTLYRAEPAPPVAAGEPARVTLTLASTWTQSPRGASGSYTRRLVYEVAIQRPDWVHVFQVDPDTGALLRDAEPPGPVVPVRGPVP